MHPDAIAVIAAHECRAAMRNRWTAGFTFVFAALALALSYFGLITQQVAGFQGFTRTAASLLNLVLYMVPLAGLVTGCLSLAGAGELIFTQPIARADVLLGKALGLSGSLAAALLFGFGLAGIIIAGQAGGDGVLRFFALAVLALLLALIFLSLGLLAATLFGGRARALGAALVLWFVFVLFYDLAVLGISVLLPERAANLFVFLSLFGNPVEVVRVAALLALAGESIFGAAGAALVKFLGGSVAASLALATAALLWVAAPLWAAARILRRRDL